MNGIFGAYRRDTLPSAPIVEATALQPLDRELHESSRIEVRRVRREARSRAVLDPLVDRQDAEIAGPSEAPVVEQGLEIAQRRDLAVAVRQDAADEVRSGQVQLVRGDRLRSVLEQRVGLVAEQPLDVGGVGLDCHLGSPPRSSACIPDVEGTGAAGAV